MDRVEWAALAYPGVMSLRGTINGVLAGRITTGLNVGTIKPGLRGNTPEFYSLISAAFVLTNSAAVLLVLTVCLPWASYSGAGLAEVAGAASVLLSAMSTSQLIMIGLTIALASASFRAGLDPDYITYPAMSTTADILKTGIYAGVVWAYSLGGLPRAAVSASAAVFGSVTLAVLVLRGRDRSFRRLLSEAAASIVIVSLIVTVTGRLFEMIGAEYGDVPPVMVSYPPVMSTAGDVGSIVGSVATTRLALGTSEGGLRIIGDLAGEIAAAWGTSALVYLMIAAAASLAAHPPGRAFSWLAPSLLAVCALAVGAIIILSLIVASVAYKKGLDPDHFVIPIESASADAVTTAVLLATLRWLHP